MNYTSTPQTTQNGQTCTCYSCNAPVPQGWGYCLSCSNEFYASSYYYGNSTSPGAQPHSVGVPKGGHDQGQHYYTPHICNTIAGGYNASCNTINVRSPSGHSLTGVSADAASTDEVLLSHGHCRCCMKPVEPSRAMSNGTCSKRCEWVSCACCPQCGRYCTASTQFIPGQPYCSIGCASQSHQANWCPTCGVRQMLVGSTHCSPHCAAQSSQNFPIRQRKKIIQQNQFLRHEVMPDNERHALLQPLRSVVSSVGLVVANVIKCAPHTVRRKSYLTFRSRVEQEMVAGGNTAKYGFGGEGNEQRRYLPLTIQCTLGTAGSTFAVPGTVAECCEDPTCTVCVALRHGINKEKMHVASHYCTADFQFSLLHAMQMPATSRSPLRGAIAVCRAVIGTPSFVRDPSQIVPGKDQSHSTIITSTGGPGKGSASEGDGHGEGTYLFRDDAIELLSILLVQ